MSFQRLAQEKCVERPPLSLMALESMSEIFEQCHRVQIAWEVEICESTEERWGRTVIVIPFMFYSLTFCEIFQTFHNSGWYDWRNVIISIYPLLWMPNRYTSVKSCICINVPELEVLISLPIEHVDEKNGLLLPLEDCACAYALWFY